MLRVTLIIGILFHALSALENQTQTIIDLYNRINQSGSLVKATSFDHNTRSRLKHINTVRMVSYRVPDHRRSLGIRMKRHVNEQIALIELRCNIADVYVRLGKSSRHRKYRLPVISQTTLSHDLTRLLSNHTRRVIYLIFPHSMANQTCSLFYYSKSNKNLFSFTSTQQLNGRFRRTILPADPSMTCAKHEYEIDFNQFSFGQWIVQPKRFNAYTCSGSCPNPLSPQYYPSNHAILLSLMRSQKPNGQQPSCVPVRLKPLCLLYYDRDELVIKYHRDMIVQECGCR